MKQTKQAAQKRGRPRVKLLDVLKHRDDRIGEICDFYERYLARCSREVGSVTLATSATAAEFGIDFRTVQRHISSTLPILQAQREYFANRDRVRAHPSAALIRLSAFYAPDELEQLSQLPPRLLVKLADEREELHKFLQRPADEQRQKLSDDADAMRHKFLQKSTTE